MVNATLLTPPGITENDLIDTKETENIFLHIVPTRFFAIFTRSGYFHLTRGGVRRPRA